MARVTRAFETLRVSICGTTVALLVREIVAYWPPRGRVVKVVNTRDPKHPKRVAYRRIRALWGRLKEKRYRAQPLRRIP